MPTGIEETLALAAKEAAKEVAMEVTKEASREVFIESAKELTETGLNESGLKTTELLDKLKTHKISSLELKNAVNYTKDFKGTGRTSEFGKEISKLELQNRGNKIIEIEPQYSKNAETGKSYRGDLLVESNPGSSIRELKKIGDSNVPREIIFSTKERLLIDVKNHNLNAFKKNISDTVEKAIRMKDLSPENISCISLPEDIATDTSSKFYVDKLLDTGARIILHSPYNECIELYKFIRKL